MTEQHTKFPNSKLRLRALRSYLYKRDTRNTDDFLLGVVWSIHFTLGMQHWTALGMKQRVSKTAFGVKKKIGFYARLVLYFDFSNILELICCNR